MFSCNPKRKQPRPLHRERKTDIGDDVPDPVAAPREHERCGERGVGRKDRGDADLLIAKELATALPSKKIGKYTSRPVVRPNPFRIEIRRSVESDIDDGRRGSRAQMG